MHWGRRGVSREARRLCARSWALRCFAPCALAELGPSAEQASVSLISWPPRVCKQLVVHIGMDASAKAIILEQCAKNRSYRDADIRGFRPARGECLPDGPEVIASEVSMKAVRKHVAVEGVEVIFSRDAGRYLLYVCDYTYYLSLHHGNGYAALIHVPRLSHWLPARLLGKALQVIIQDMLEELRKPELEASFAENSTVVIPAQGNQLGDCSFREN
ncbi:pyroglutamyl-peptidase 1-like protein [Meles meles]|uniref:pyroglutamyl-peptidase 1-like protein n=1 Tax=Meles meles TaxID=9662 RepID=UPI001E69A9F8|nr:pyroglutamyl-peptidase 1-like protein [Meles meles]